MCHSDDASAHGDDLSKLGDDVSRNSDEISTQRDDIPPLGDDVSQVIRKSLRLPGGLSGSGDDTFNLSEERFRRRRRCLGRSDCETPETCST